MNYIISGSKGLIGEKLKERLDKEHECIFEVDPRLGSNLIDLNSLYMNLNTQSVEIFFHLGAFCKINEAIKTPKLAHLNNAEGTFQALEFCRINNIKKFVYFSSSRVLSEEETIYTATKKYGEHLCEAYKQCYGIEYIIVRPSTVYREHHDLTERMLSKWVIKYLKGEKVQLYGGADKTLDFTHVDDFVDGIMLLLSKWDEVKNTDYDISGDDQRKLIDVADILGADVEILPPEMAQPQQVKIDISKMRALGYDPKIKLEEGVKRMIDFYKTEGNKWLKN